VGDVGRDNRRRRLEETRLRRSEEVQEGVEANQGTELG